MTTIRSQRKPTLEVSDITITRGGTDILDGVSWRMDAGQHWVILGGNGSGKTSLLSALTGYLTPTEGEIALLGERFGESDWRKLRERIGIVSSSLRELMSQSETALETVVTGKYAMVDHWGKVKETDRKPAMRILKQIDCVALADRPWAYLSQGERQRVLIGRALMSKPKLLILDEPCAGLDPAAREHFLQFIERLGRKRNAPALALVTHHVEEIMPVFTHILMLRDGKVLTAGEKSKILTSRNLSAVFGAKTKLRQSAGRYQLTVSASDGLVM